MTAPGTERTRHGGNVTGSGDHVGTGSLPSVTHGDDIPTLNRMTAHGQRVALAYYEAGVMQGIEMGRAQMEAEFAAIHRQAHAVVQQIARQPTYAELAELRGEPDRAERQREELRRRGIAA